MIDLGYKIGLNLRSSGLNIPENSVVFSPIFCVPVRDTMDISDNIIGAASNFKVIGDFLWCNVQVSSDPGAKYSHSDFLICSIISDNELIGISGVCTSIRYHLYKLVTTNSGLYRIYGPHVYKFHDNPPQSKHNIGNWVPDSTPIERLLQQTNVISITTE